LGKDIEHPVLLGLIIDRDEVAAEGKSLCLRSSPCVLREQDVLVAVGWVCDRPGEDVGSGDKWQAASSKCDDKQALSHTGLS